MSVKIRPMVSADKPSVVQILQNTLEFKPFEVAVAEDLINAYLEKGKTSGYSILVAETGHQVTGYVCFGDTPLTEGTWDIYWIAVSRTKQGEGIGSALMKAAEDEIRKINGRLVLIETSSTIEYEKTRRFYHGIGYNIICRIPDFYVPGDDKIILQKRI